METENLRKDCKKLMIDLGLDRQGNREILANEISTPDDHINPNSLSMALTGYRNGSRSLEILERLFSYLSNESMIH